MALAALLLVLAAVPSPALTLVYVEGSGGEINRHTLVIEPSPGGFAVGVTIERGGRVAVVQELETDPALSALRWRWVEAEAGTDVTAVREGEVIVLAGLRGGRRIERRFAVGDEPWYQLFPLGLEPLARAGVGSTRFAAIGTTGIASMRIGLFRATVAGPEEVAWGCGRVAAIRVRISLSGAGSILWHGDYWYRAADGRHLVAVSDRGPGTRSQRMELVEAR